MENENTESIINKPYVFLNDRKAKDVFAKIDYHFRSGVHIQREYPKPEELFRFIEKHFESIQSYYADFFQLKLEKGGEELSSRYYYLDFSDEIGRSKIPSDYKYKKYMETSHIIIGMLYFKMYRLDANIELDTIDGFIQLLLTEYEEEKNGLFKLIAGTKNEKSSDHIDDAILTEIRDAFNEFEKLGWIEWLDDSKNKFQYLSSFERLRKIYQPQITTIDDLINKLNAN
jgi:hypothetical protein